MLDSSVVRIFFLFCHLQFVPRNQSLRISAPLSSLFALLTSAKFQFMVYKTPIYLFLVPSIHVPRGLPISRHLIKVSKQKASFIKHILLKSYYFSHQCVTHYKANDIHDCDRKETDALRAVTGGIRIDKILQGKHTKKLNGVA